MRLRQLLGLSLLFAGGVIWVPPAFSGAQLGGEGDPVAGQGEMQTRYANGTSRSGAFHSFNPELGLVWINDYAYRLHPGFKVIGNSTKMGSVSAIKRGEIVEFVTVPDSKDPRRKLLVEIRRK